MGGGGPTGTGGGGGCPTNTDGDGLDDCTEQNDGDPWTDPNIFNGMHVRFTKECSASPACADTDTIVEVDACMALTPIAEQKDQYSGWNWPDSPDSICSAAYNFKPNWTNCSYPDVHRWQADWQGYINLTQSGNHCFDALGLANEACASIFFNTETTGITYDSGAKCFNMPAGVYPIRWYYGMDNGSNSDMHITYCFGGGAPCIPAVATPATMLRVSP